MLLPLQSTTPSPSTREPKKEQQEEIEIRIAPTEIPTMIGDIKDAIHEQVQGKTNLIENSKEVDDEEARCFSTHTFDKDNINQELQKVEEEQ